MEVYVLYDCVENPDEWAFAGVEHVYASHADAVGRMQKLFIECLNDHKEDNADDADDTLDTAIDSWGAVVEDTSTGYRHTWTITEETVV